MVAVLGTREDPLTGPGGRFAVELVHPETGRVRKRVEADNSLMSWFLGQTPANGGRGQFYAPGAADYAASFGLLNYITDFVDDNQLGLAFKKGWAFRQSPIWSQRWLWATAYNQNPNPSATQIPVADPLGDVTGGVMLTSGFAADGVQNRRGTVVYASSERTWARTRMVTEFNTNQGNGVYRSLGLGSLIAQTLAPGGMRPCPSLPDQDQLDAIVDNASWDVTYGRLAGTASASTILVYDASYDADEEAMWVQYGTSVLALIKDGTATSFTTGNVPGNQSNGGFTVVPGNNEIWIANGTDLFRCEKRTTAGNFAVLNTYDLTASLAGDILTSATHDGTSLYLMSENRVLVVNPVTGAVTSSWAHGLTFEQAYMQTITYDAANGCLWLTSQATIGATYEGWGYLSSGTPSSMSVDDSLVSHAFTTAGADVPHLRLMHIQAGVAGSTSNHGACVAGMSPTGTMSLCALRSGITVTPKLQGPSMASHALLNADVVKTPADALRITYDWNYT